MVPRPVWELFPSDGLDAGAPYRWLHEDERATTKHLPIAIHFGPHLSPPSTHELEEQAGPRFSWRESTRRGAAPRMAHLPSAPPSSPPSLALPLAASRAPRVRSRPGHRMDGELLHRPRWPACECVGERLAEHSPADDRAPGAPIELRNVPSATGFPCTRNGAFGSGAGLPVASLAISQRRRRTEGSGVSRVRGR